MPTPTPAPALPAAVTLIICSACKTGNFSVRSDGRFSCPCGEIVRPQEIDMDSQYRWGVTPAGLLANAPAPVDAYRDFLSARSVMSLPGSWGPTLEAAHEKYRDALAELDAARFLGLELPQGIDVQIGRVYLACVIKPDGTLAWAAPFALGWDCEQCAPWSTDPKYQKRYPCRDPRGHAWTQVNRWAGHGGPSNGHTYDVLSPRAADLPSALERAAEILAGRAARAALQPA